MATIVKYADVIPYLDETATKKSWEEATDPKRVSKLSEDEKRVRENQQLKMKELAAIAKENEQKKRLEQKERKRVKTPMESKAGKGQRLGRDTATASDNSRSSYDPMNPWSSSDGARYRYVYSVRFQIYWTTHMRLT